MNRSALVIIEARTQSTRLPGKVLRLLTKRQSVLSFLIERYGRVFNRDSIVVATTLSELDHEIVCLAHSMSIKVFRGSTNDVLDRVYQAAKHFKADVILEITGDNPLSDPFLCKEALRVYGSARMTLLSTDLYWHNRHYPLHLPIGLGFKIFDFDSLEYVWKYFNHRIDREHVVNGMVASEKIVKQNYSVKINCDPFLYRLTVDYPRDLEVVRDVILNCRNGIAATSEDIISYLDANVEIRRLNQGLKQTNYSRPHLC